MDDPSKVVVGTTPQQTDHELYQGISQNLTSAGVQSNSQSVSPHTADKPILEVIPELEEGVREGIEVVEGVAGEIPRAFFGGTPVRVTDNNQKNSGSPLRLLKEKFKKLVGKAA